MLRALLFKSLLKPPFTRAFVSHEPFNELDYDAPYRDYLIKLKALTYSELLIEVKKYPGKPSSRQKVMILKFIADSLPKKGSPPLIKPTTINVNSATNTKQPPEPPKPAVQPEIDEDEVGENLHFTLSNQSLYSNVLRDGSLTPFMPLFYSPSRQLTETRSFIENYSPNQILSEAQKMAEKPVRSEIMALVSRSSLFRNSRSLDARVMTIRKREVRRVFYEMMNMEGEFQHATVDHLACLMAQIRENQIYNYTLNRVISDLGDPFLCLNHISYFKGAPLNFIHLTWEAMSAMIDVYSRQDLVTLLSAMYHFKTHLNYFALNEVEVFEKLSFKIVENIVREPECFDIFDFATVLSLFKLSKIAINQKIDHNLAIIAELFFSNYINSINSKTTETSTRKKRNAADNLNLLHAYTFCSSKFQNKKEVLDQILNNIEEKIIASGLRHYEKIYVLKILSLLMAYGIKITESLAIEIQQNTKAFESLTFHEIYLYIEAFKETKLDPNAIYQILYLAFSSNLELLPSNPDFKILLIIAKIQAFFLKKRIFEQRRNTYNKKVSIVLSTIENTLENMDLKEKVNDLFLLSSLFNPYLNIPNFLFKKILENKSHIVVNKDNKKVIAGFVNDILERIEPQYTMISFLQGTDIDLADKITPELIEIFSVLLKKFKALNLLSFNLLTINMLSNEKLRKACFIEAEERTAYLEFLSQQIVFSCQKIANLSLEILVGFSKFLAVNASFLNKELKAQVSQEIFAYLSERVPKSLLKFNDVLPIMYYLGRGFSSQESPSKKMADFFRETVVRKVEANGGKTLLRIVYDNSVVQTFTPNVKNSNFAKLEFLIPTMDSLKVEVSEERIRSIMNQLSRDCGNWSGRILIENLLILNKMKVNAWEIFEKSIENLTTLMVFYVHQQKFMVNPEYTDEVIIEVLKAYAEQYEKLIANNQKKCDENIRKTPLSLLLAKVFDKLEQPDILKIIKIIGSNEQNYVGKLIEKLKATNFQPIPEGEILSVFGVFPTFLTNKSIEIQLYNLLDKIPNQPHNSIDLLNVFSLRHLWKQNCLTSIPFTPELLSYMSTHSPSTLEMHALLTSIFSSDWQTLSTSSKADLLFLIFSIEARNSSLSCLRDINFPNPAEELPIDAAKKEFLINTLLRSEEFFFCEKELLFDSKPTVLKYARSFEIGVRPPLPGWKVLPLNSGMATAGSEENLFSMIDLTNSPVRFSNYQEIWGDYMKFFLFMEYYPLAKISNKNEPLFARFRKAQSRLLSSLKSEDRYANFLVEVSLILNTLEVSYKTTYICEETGILIDIAVQETRRALVFYDDSQSVSVLGQNGVRKTYPNNLVIAKARILEKIGKWQVLLINFEEWMKECNTRSKREEFLTKCKAPTPI